MNNELYDLYLKIEEAKFELYLSETFPKHNKNKDVAKNRIDLLEEEFKIYVSENLETLKEQFTKASLNKFIEDSYKFLIKPRYGLQGIYEDYNFDDVEIDDNLILQRELQKYYYKSYNSLFSETHSNYKKMLFILKMMGELHGD